MAAKLECEVCGGKLIGKPGGIFECESCGMEYSTEWARQKIQEIRGTVQVEGTVQVTGKVQVEGGTVNVEGAATKESLLKRAKMCCAEKDWNKAKELLEQVLNADPECGEAYLYRYLVAQKQPTLEALVADCRSHFAELPTNSDLKKAEQFADEKLIGLLNRCKQECADTAAADQAQRQTSAGALAEKRKALEPVRKFIACGYEYTVGLRADGRVLAVGCNSSGECDVGDWRDVVAIAYSGDRTVGLHADGTVVATGKNDSGQCNVSDWKLFNSIETLDQELAEAQERRKREAEEARRQEEQRKQARLAELEAEKIPLQAELAGLKGLFTGKRRKEIMARLAAIEAEQESLHSDECSDPAGLL